MYFKQFNVGGDRNFAYLIADESSMQAAVVDPAYSPQILVEEAEKLGFEIKYIINTHDHYDHTNGNKKLKASTGAQIVQNASAYGNADIRVNDNGSLWLGGLELKFIHTPGHTQDSMCIMVENMLCTGDTLFVGKVGGTDFSEGARLEYNSLRHKLMTLPEDTRVWPGHDYGVAPSSTIGHEKRTNPFLLRPDFESFVDLKRNWAEYKLKHGIA